MRRCDTGFDAPEVGNKTIIGILDRADRIVPGHFPELTRLPNGAFGWEGQPPSICWCGKTRENAVVA